MAHSAAPLSRLLVRSFYRVSRPKKQHHPERESTSLRPTPHQPMCGIWTSSWVLCISALALCPLHLCQFCTPCAGSFLETAPSKSAKEARNGVGALNLKRRVGARDPLSSSIRRSSRLHPKGSLFLEEPISSRDLEGLDLGSFTQPGDVAGDHLTPVLGCQGNECPRFSDCNGGSIRSCHVALLQDSGNLVDLNDTRESATCPKVGDLSAGRVFYPGCQLATRDTTAAEWAPQIVILRDVFVTRDGSVFNTTHRFYPGGCIEDPKTQPKFAFDQGTRALELERVVNFAMGFHGRHRVFEIMERLPLFVTMSPMLDLLAKDSKFFLGESKVHAGALNQILGPSARANSVVLPPGQLLFARVLYQPIHSACTVASPNLWSFIRQSFFLPPGTLPLFTRNWTMTHPLPERTDNPISDKSLSPRRLNKLPEDWVVVLAMPPSCTSLSLRNDWWGAHKRPHEVEDAIHNNFWFGRVELFTWENDNLKMRDLFNRAALFVTTPGASLGSIAFMPQGSAVILLERERSTQPGLFITHSGMSARMRSFAHASGVAATTVLCEADAASSTGGLLCSKAQFVRALAWAANHLFNSPLLPQAPIVSRAARSIPGSRLQSWDQVKAFRSWSDCVSQKGEWKLDPIPRPLAWPYHGYLERCDKEHIDSVEGGVAGQLADDIALEGKPDRDAWKVRHGLKYRWQVNSTQCPHPKLGSKGARTGSPKAYKAFSPGAFCDVIGRKARILLIGDSIQEQLAAALVQGILIGSPKPVESSVFSINTTQECSDWLSGAKLRHKFCSMGRFTGAQCPGLVVEFIRNDLLRILTTGPPVFDRMPFAQHITSDRRRQAPKAWVKPRPAGYMEDFVETCDDEDFRKELHSLTVQLLLDHLDSADIIIFNRGPHYTPTDQFMLELEGVTRFLRMKFPEKLLIYRNTPPGHVNCTSFDRPMRERQDRAGLPYNWDTFVEQNQRAKEIVEALGVVYMDVDSMTSLRADGHKGFWPELNIMDCLHYCQPGPIDGWVELLFNLIAKLYGN